MTRNALPRPSKSRIKRILTTVLRQQRKPTSLEINVIFVDNKEIRRLSRLYIGEDHNTDVIAFPYEKPGPFGDIFVSLPMAQSNAKRFGQPYQTEVTRLIIHGLLHLLGYDDHAAAKRKKMWAVQEKLVEHLS